MVEARQYDVVVVGAGVSGIPAAIAAARAGARVLLLEEDALPGGAPVDQYITMPCGEPHAGLYGEMLRVLDRDHRIPVAQDGPLARGWYRWYLPSAYVQVLSAMLASEPNLTLRCATPVTRPLVEDRDGRRCVTGVIIDEGGEECRIHAQVTVDATGSGALAHAAGCASMYGIDAQADFGEPHAPGVAEPRVQDCTWMYISQRLGQAPYCMRELEFVGMVDPGFAWVGVDHAEALRRDSGIYLHWGCRAACDDTRDPAQVAAAQQEGLRQMQSDLAILHRHGFMTYLAPKIGIRESRRILGEHVITEQDLRSGIFPDDTIAVGQWFLDIWGGKLSKADRYVPPFGIPYRVLIPREVDGVLVAGKAISGTHIAMSAYRVQPIMAHVGQAAGLAAALCASGGTQPRRLDAQTVRDALIAPGQGAVLHLKASPPPALGE